MARLLYLAATAETRGPRSGLTQRARNRVTIVRENLLDLEFDAILADNTKGGIETAAILSGVEIDEAVFTLPSLEISAKGARNRLIYEFIRDRGHLSIAEVRDKDLPEYAVYLDWMITVMSGLLYEWQDRVETLRRGQDYRMLVVTNQLNVAHLTAGIVAARGFDTKPLDDRRLEDGDSYIIDMSRHSTLPLRESLANEPIPLKRN